MAPSGVAVPRALTANPCTQYVRPRLSGPKKAIGTVVRLRPSDPFELIRWLARSQTDPRKAVAELVQNSLDAAARRIRLTRRRIHRFPVLIVEDDGEGVIPELSREDALHYLATHIGHSRKLGLTPEERAKRVVAGQYGVGLLGFWAIGRRLELRTRVGSSPLFALRLAENEPRASIVKLPVHLDALATFTEVVVSEVHSAAQRVLGGRRLAEYLAAELRGQLLTRQVEITVHDRLARGLAQKHFPVVPRRFVGEKLSIPSTVEVPGYAPLRIELYLARGAEKSSVQVACAGTLVAEDVSELGALNLDHPPWVGRSLSGMIDFPAFSVAPGSRRGVVPDLAATAFVDALNGLTPLVERELDRLEREQAQAANRDILRDLRRALRGLHRRLPNYELPSIEGRGTSEGVAPTGEEVLEETQAAQLPDQEAVVELFPFGPAACVRIEPPSIELAPGKERRVLAIATDQSGRRITQGATFAWATAVTGVSVRGNGARPAVIAAPDARVGATGPVHVSAECAGTAVSGEATITVVEPSEEEEGMRLGIPEPKLVSDPGALWRSRLAGASWEINDAHEDYLALRSDSRARLRYLLALLAKEIVQRSYGQPGSGALLERMVEILAHAERNLRGG